jgi:hypothetical protein
LTTDVIPRHIDAMADPQPDDAEDSKVREEWRRIERKRLDDEIAEAREDVGSATPVRHRPHWLVWLAFAVALVAGIVVTAAINGAFVPTP